MEVKKYCVILLLPYIKSLYCINSIARKINREGAGVPMGSCKSFLILRMTLLTSLLDSYFISIAEILLCDKVGAFVANN